jgi:patatin-related protein
MPSDSEAEEQGEAPELRLALGMRGGVSLAVWIGGACAEIDELRRGEASFWKRLVEACGYSGVAVDVLAGASAGGLNGVLFASAIRHGFAMNDLFQLWLDLASVEPLRRQEPPWLSLFDGDGAFLDKVYDELTAKMGPGAGKEGASTTEGQKQPVVPSFIDLQLTATHVEPVAIPATSPTDERLGRQRSAARFHFHKEDGVAGRDDFDGAGAPARLAVAARATSSFPGAFEAAVVRSSRPDHFGENPPTADAPGHRLVDCRGVFSDSRGKAASDQAVRADDFVVADGGIVDNIPLGRALDAVAAAPACGPTKRVLVYLHPTGPPPPVRPRSGGDGAEASDAEAAGAAGAAGAARRTIVAVAKGTLAAKVQGESIDGDLDQLERHNRAVRMAHLLRRRTLEGLKELENPGIRVELEALGGRRVTDEQWLGYAAQRPTADATRLHRLLDNPLHVLGEDPFPGAPDGDDGVWRAPLAYWDDSCRVALDGALATEFVSQLDTAREQPPSGGVWIGASGDAMFGAGLAALRRAVDLALEWVRAIPASAATSQAKPALYRLRAAVSVLERARRLGWVTFAAFDRPADGSELAGWCTRALSAVDQLLIVSSDEATRFLDGERSAYDTRADAALQTLVGAPPVTTVNPAIGDPTDLRTEILSRLVEQVDKVRESSTALSDDHPARLIDTVVRDWSGATKDKLAALEVLFLAEHLLGAPYGGEIAFFRMSAAAEAPVAAYFTRLRKASTRLDTVRRDGWTTSDTFLRPEVKLAGNELSNFGAFFDRRWRENDWMWGRLDAVSCLVDIVLSSATDAAGGNVSAEARDLAGCADGATLDDVRTALIHRRQVQVLNELKSQPGFPTPVDPATWTVGLETLNEPGSADIQRAVGDLVATASNVAHDVLPPSLRWLAGPVGRLGRGAAWRLTRPTGHLPDELTSPAEAEPGPVPSEHTTRSSSSRRIGLGVVLPVVAGTLVAAVAWAMAASRSSLIVGVVAGLLAGLSMVGALLLVAWRRPPGRSRSAA